ncbi:site-specific DNA-methyltransferase, partial [Pelomonas sp. HMWF004]
MTKKHLDTIIHGDCFELMKKFSPDSIDLTVTSPPYDNLRVYNGYEFNFEGIVQQLYRITKPGGVVVWVI